MKNETAAVKVTHAVEDQVPFLAVYMLISILMSPLSAFRQPGLIQISAFYIQEMSSRHTEIDE